MPGDPHDLLGAQFSPLEEPRCRLVPQIMLAQIAPAAPAWQAQPGASQPHRINEQRVELCVVGLERSAEHGHQRRVPAHLLRVLPLDLRLGAAGLRQAGDPPR